MIAVETAVPGGRVNRVEPEDLVMASDLANRAVSERSCAAGGADFAANGAAKSV
jgi:hypothetical protein